MKKALLPLLVLLLLSSGALTAYAAPAGAFCATQPDCDPGLVCAGGACEPPSSSQTALPTSNSGSTFPNATPAATLAATTQSTGGTGGLNSSATNFVSLTNLPGISTIATSNTVSAFFQNLYKICIGIAAVLAVLQLVRAGVMYMGGDSVTETRKARELIGTTLFGLLLVLSPIIVFGIINPSILSLNIGVSNLQSSSPASPSSSSSPTPAGGTAQGSVAPGGTCTNDTDCADPNGSFGCYKANGASQGICTVDGDPPADGTAQPGEACTNDNSCADVNGQSYGCNNGTCTLFGD